MNQTFVLIFNILLTMAITTSLTFLVLTKGLRKLFRPTLKELEKTLLARKGRAEYLFDLRRYKYECDGGYSNHRTKKEQDAAWMGLWVGPMKNLASCKCVLCADDDNTYIIDSPTAIWKSEKEISLTFITVALDTVSIERICAVTKDNRYLGKFELNGDVILSVQLCEGDQFIFTFTMKFDITIQESL